MSFGATSSLGRVSRPELNVHRATVNGLVDAILADPAILKVDDMVDRHGTGKRNLHKLFREYVGVTPKWVILR
jgi:methylphosphotriester-DNA--protein-cysteine methyltransferase